MKHRLTALLIDDDLSGLTIFGEVLRRDGFEVLTAADGRTGVSVASGGAPDVIVLDLRLPDLSGIDALRMIRRAVRTVPVIMMTAYPTTTSVVEAMRLGAVDYIEKPLTESDLLHAVQAAVSSSAASEEDDRPDAPACHAAARWADAVARVLDAPQDPRTVRLWGRHIGASPGALRNWCRMAGLSSKRSLNLARMIRAMLWASPSDLPENLLNVTDRRTLTQLMKLGNPDAAAHAALPRTIDEFLVRQRWITDRLALDELKRTLSLRAGRLRGTNEGAH